MVEAQTCDVIECYVVYYLFTHIVAYKGLKNSQSKKTYANEH